MQLSNRYKRLPCDQIIVKREERQRRNLKVELLLPSIKMWGVLNPIIISDDFTLIAGERRLAASIAAGFSDIPVRFASELSPIESQIIELEENIARSDLEWNDRVSAVFNIHSMYKSLDPEWSQQKTADALGMTKGTISMYLNVGEAVLDGNEKLGKATTIRQALNVLNRDTARRDADIISDLTEGITPRDEGGPDSPGQGSVEAPGPSIICGDFSAWARDYSGPKFNFLHCDFPYGVNMQTSDQGNSELYGAYEDTPEVYWKLLSTLAEFQNNFMSSSAHLMFWFSMKFYRETLEFARECLPDWEFDLFPLIWTKSDNKGILPDPKRGPRRIYETCFFASRGDRPVVRAVSNSYPAPTGIKAHQSEKPEPVLRHFMQMFVDEHSRMLDPTCGSGSSLRAAESLGANHVFGLELNPEFATSALSSLKIFRAKRLAEKVIPHE